jgi:hypothetical protein
MAEPMAGCCYHPALTATGGWFHVSWWVWAILAWLLASVAFAVLVGKFIAVGRAQVRASAEEEILIDLTAPEPGPAEPPAPETAAPHTAAPHTAAPHAAAPPATGPRPPASHASASQASASQASAPRASASQACAPKARSV